MNFLFLLNTKVSQYMHLSSHYIVHLKLIVSYILYLDKTGIINKGITKKKKMLSLLVIATVRNIP